MLRLLSLSIAVACASAAFSQMLPNRPGLTLDEDSAWVVNTTRVSRQLQLGPAQQQRVTGAFDSYDRSQQAIYAHGAASQEQLDTLDHKLASNVLGALTAKQRTRLHQLALQLSGPFVLTEAAVATEVGLTAPQKAKILSIVNTDRRRQEAFEDSEGTIMTAHPNASPALQKQLLAPFDSRRKALKTERRQDEQKILHLLTKAQMTKWNVMLGPRML